MIKTKKCVICGKDFEVEIRDSDRKILTKCFYNPDLLENYGVEYWECSVCCDDDNPDYSFVPSFVRLFGRCL